RARGVDWAEMLEQVCQFVLISERTGEPSISLRDVLPQPTEDEFYILGLRFPRTHPSIKFGDGATLKSYIELTAAATHAVQGLRVGYCGWDRDKFTHRRRLEQICGSEMPDVRYVRCDKPLIHEVTRIKRSIQDDRLDYAFLDSAGYGTQGPPEAAEAAIE